MKMFAKIFLVVLIFMTLPFTAQAQTAAPDCYVSGRFTAIGRQGGPAFSPASGFNNKITGCFTWWLTLTIDGFSAAEVALEDAPDEDGAAGTWEHWTGTLILGSNPSTSTTFTVISATGFFPWVSVEAEVLTGTGTVTWSLYGWKGDKTNNATGTQDVNITEVDGDPPNFAQETGGHLATIDTSTAALATIISSARAAVSPISGVAGIAGGAGATSSTTTRIVPASDATIRIVATNGDSITATTDPCSGLVKTTYVINISTATTTEIANADASNKMYVCAIHIIAAAANNIALVESTADTCGSSNTGMAGGATAATGWNITGNGLSLGNGSAMVMKTSAVNRYVCLITSGAVQSSGAISYVLAP